MRTFRWRRTLLAVVGVTVFLLTFLQTPDWGIAQDNHFLPDDSVNSGRALYYADLMACCHSALAHADAQWSQRDRVLVRPAPRRVNPTVEFYSYSDLSPNADCGRYLYGPGRDKIRINRGRIENGGCGSNAPNSIVTHELGHGLGINDHTNDRYAGDLMFIPAVYRVDGQIGQMPTTPQNHDWRDYRDRWG